ncbi:MAG: hypothetical protein R2795_10015 [Saprospiraceae bacterium]
MGKVVDIRKQLLSTHSKENTTRIVAWIGHDPARFAALITCMRSEEQILVQRASWVLCDTGCIHPQLLSPYMEELLGWVQRPVHPALQRNLLKPIAESKHLFDDEEIEGKLVSICFDLLLNPAILPAAQVHAMQCIANRLHNYPDLAIELAAILEEGIQHAEAAYASRAKRLLKQIRKGHMETNRKI